MTRAKAKTKPGDAAPVEPRPDVSYTHEGGGIVATCTGCGWEAWRGDQASAETAAHGHKKCRSDDVAFHARRRAARRVRR